MTLVEQNRSLWKHLHRVEFLLAQQIQLNKKQKKYFNKKIGRLAKVLDHSFGVDPVELNEGEYFPGFLALKNGPVSLFLIGISASDEGGLTDRHGVRLTYEEYPE